MDLEQTIELVDFPVEKGRYKVVQIILRDKPYLLCGENNSWHKDILENFLKKQRINFRLVKTKLNVDSLIPAPEGAEYKVTGMGTIELDPHFKFLQLPYDGSHDYGIPADKSFYPKLKEQFPGWMF